MISRSLYAALFLFSAFPAGAAVRTWTGGGADSNWNNQANWSPAGVPDNGDSLVFPAGTDATTNNNLAGRTFSALTFQASTVVTGNAFTVTGGITSSPAAIGSAVSIQPQVTLGASLTISSGGAILSSLTFDGGVASGANTLTVSGSRLLNFNGITGSSNAASRFVSTMTGQVRFGTSAILVAPQPVTLSTGTLDVDGFFQAPLEMTGGTLTGSGILGLTLDASGGDIIPDADDLSVTGNTVLRGSVNLQVRLAGASTEHALECGGSVSLQGGATLEVLSPSYTPVRGDVFQVLGKSTSSAITGTFSNMPSGAEITIGPSVIRATYTGGNGNDLTFSTVAVTRTWNGGATLNDNWDDPDNWVGGTAPLAGDILVFPSGIGSTDRGMDNNFPDNTAFRKLVFNGDDFTVRGAPFRVSHGITVANSVQANLDTDVTLSADQTFVIDGILHLDLLDKINTNGKTLTLGSAVSGSLTGGGIMQGKITGSGSVVVAPGVKMDLYDKNDYAGTTLIPAGSTLGLVKINSTDGGFLSEGQPGSAAAATIIEGTLDIQNRMAPTGYDIDEPLELHGGGQIVLGAVATAGVDLHGPLLLSGAEEMEITLDAEGRLTLFGIVSGQGNLKVAALATGSDPLSIAGAQSNTFKGTLTVEDTSLLLEKVQPGLIAVSCADLIIAGADALVETRQDEQIVDSCHVHVTDGNLNIGNITSRTETIATLTLEGGTASGPDNSLLVTGRINAPGTAGSTIRVNTRLSQPDSVVDVSAGGGSLKIQSGLSRSGSAQLRKTGAGTLELASGASLPVQIDGGNVLLRNALPHLVSLNGGTLTGNGTVGGGITSMTGGGTIAPFGTAGQTAVLPAGQILLNAATAIQMQISSATPGTGHDQISVTGAVSLGEATLSLQLLAGFNVALNAQVVLIANDGTDAVNGTFAGLPEGAFIPIPADNGGGGWFLSYKGGTGNDVVLTRIPFDPAPVVTLFSIGAADQNQNRPVTILGRGAPGFSYRIESSVDLDTWTAQGAAQTALTGTGALNFSVTASPPVRPKQYFRIRRL